MFEGTQQCTAKPAPLIYSSSNLSRFLGYNGTYILWRTQVSRLAATANGPQDS